MKHLAELTEQLLEHEHDPAYRRELKRLLQAHDNIIDMKVREEYGQLIRRDKLAEAIAGGMRDGIAALVESCLDARQVPPGLREELEAVFSEALETAISRSTRA